jgi:hypothetical protein
MHYAAKENCQDLVIFNNNYKIKDEYYLLIKNSFQKILGDFHNKYLDNVNKTHKVLGTKQGFYINAIKNFHILKLSNNNHSIIRELKNYLVSNNINIPINLIEI